MTFFTKINGAKKNSEAKIVFRDMESEMKAASI